ncbi:MAG: amino acid permease, partial [Oscillospiraceae bacterium]|nr:amino acid permease [Oscillospiraceae bacterium]
IAVNYSYMLNAYPDAGGAFSYAKRTFGYDHGFLSAWFLILTYIAIIWANASALPLIARNLLGSTFQFGFNYTIAGFHVWFGELLLAVAALAVAAIICLNNKISKIVQIISALVMCAGIGAAYFACRTAGASPEPAFSPSGQPVREILNIICLAPWAFVGFESISHSAAEFKFDKKKSLGIMLISLLTAGTAYAMLAVTGAMVLPEGVGSWTEYVARLGEFSGLESIPTFFASVSRLGDMGKLIMGVTALGAILTGLVGNLIAASRLLYAMAEDKLLPDWFGSLTDSGTPKNAILFILALSLPFPFLGRTAISWIVDVTTVGAAIAYAYVSGCALKLSREKKNTPIMVFAGAGLAASGVFALYFLVPNMLSVTTLSTESYLILAAWSILGFLFYRMVFKNDTEHRLGRSTVVWIALLALIIFTSLVWARQSTEKAVVDAVSPIQEHYASRVDETIAEEAESKQKINEVLDTVESSLTANILVYTGLIVAAIAIIFNVYSILQRREKQIMVEKALAEESSRAKTSFLSNMSHEIRTPMNAIIGLDNIALKDPALPPQTREQLEKIGASARHLLGLINDILDMSRIESGRMVLKSEEFAFKDLVEAVNIIINGQCADKGLSYEFVPSGDIDEYFIGDDMKLKQVLINILGNSVKFTPAPGKVTLTVEETARFEGHCTLRFTLKDTGIGMDEEYIPKLFEAFSQEDATTTNRYGGSGLGMAITKNLVDMMNGDIKVESEKGVGSTFIVTVTLRASGRASRESEKNRNLSRLRVLVVDDDAVACEHAQMVLSEMGIEAETCQRSTEAYSLIRQRWTDCKPFHIVMTDYRMPVMDGGALTEEIRRFDNGRTAIIVLTGYDIDEIGEKAKKAGADSVLPKPLFSDSLQREIQAVMRTRGETFEEEETPDVNILEGKRVLMVEDIEINAEILADLLEMRGVSSEHAENGAVAVDMFAAAEPGYYDAVLMDVRMPVKDGLEATRCIRALDKADAKTVPIIAMTADAFDEDVQRSLQAGMNAHLSKPVDPERLYDTLAKFIKG